MSVCLIKALVFLMFVFVFLQFLVQSLLITVSFSTVFQVVLYR